MANHELEGFKYPDNTPSQQEQLSHEALVRHVRNLIRVHQDTYASIRSGNERPVLPPETVIRNVLEWYASPATERGEMFFTLRRAWDALAYERYEIGSKEESLAGSLLQSYFSATGEDRIRLTDPQQVRMLDAMAEAAGVPRERGQTAVAIPQKARNYNQYLMSAEYQRKFDQARTRKNK